jgi:hypothetical protein
MLSHEYKKNLAPRNLSFSAFKKYLVSPSPFIKKTTSIFFLAIFFNLKKYTNSEIFRVKLGNKESKALKKKEFEALEFHHITWYPIFNNSFCIIK